MQLGMLVDSNLSDRPWVNVEQIVCHLDDEPIDVAALEAAWGHVQREHEILRTSFTFDPNDDDDGDNDGDGDERIQQVHASAPLSLVVHDRRGLSDAERRVSAAVTERLTARCASSGATLATSVMAAWALLLARSTNRSDVVFGSTRAGRHTIPGATSWSAVSSRPSR